MTTVANIVKTDAISYIANVNQTYGGSSTDITIGNNTTVVNIANPNVNTIVSKVFSPSTQTFTLTINDFLANGTFICPKYTSANPSTVNDVITVNLPDPTSAIEGMFFCFRKIRGALNTSTQNWLFTSPNSSILISSNGLTQSGTPTTSSFAQTALTVRIVVLGYAGVYYYVLY